MDGHKERASEAFFGRRRGKALRAAQIKREETLLPLLKLDLSKPAPEQLAELFFNGDAPHVGADVRIEIGFGGGEHLVHEMDRFPQTGFIGVEPFVNGMAKLLGALEGQKQRLQHIRLYDDDATELLDWLPSSSIAGIDLFYPDPWPKKKHWKRRFVNEKNLDRFARVLKKGAPFRFASDIDTYVNWTLFHCAHHPDFIWSASTPDDWKLPFQEWPGTRYEEKAMKAGRTPAYLTFVRK
ncbi:MULTISPECIES: tRNA (guanosine(46)-N(7))-methyltransferase TrmB [Bartonella]|uniref:tRNA (guanine(46)-N(7))-methyltransferase TrmB n=1 Tax=Bartonella TaxID=773 RepID=UPI0018DCC87F|nr:MULTISPECIES: tRNA (guanine(46)-N(7))-methyltransferase TrmB [Bartonella]MBH9974572.1 tRNA (guanosine(46)-N7)-methyltransferase TrmB [Bartonella choladocola]MBI0014179.1 tRNA (guanosine(46)-N7)-methyltransferase TrmB [Bartonella sp. B10834G3]